MVLLLSVVAGCGARYPLNIPEEQWLLMTPQQQLDARTQQAALDQAAHERRAAEARAREAEALKQAAELEERRRNALYGERVQCVLDPAEAYLRGRWDRVRPLAMDLVIGFDEDLDLRDLSGRSAGRLRVGFDGQVVSLCSATSSTQFSRDCAQMFTTRQQLQRGVSQSVEQDKLIRGQLYCDLVPEASGGYRRVR